MWKPVSLLRAFQCAAACAKRGGGLIKAEVGLDLLQGPLGAVLQAELHLDPTS